MASAEYLQWLGRGREHQAQGRVVDAMLCYRRAIRCDRHLPDAHFHLGEVLLQLGRLTDATGAWIEAASVAPEFLPAQRALVDAYADQGNAVAARAAAMAALAAEPANPHAVARLALAEWLLAIESASADAPVPAADVLGAALGRAPSILAVPAFAGTLARSLDRAVPAATIALRDQLVDAARDPDLRAAMPAALFANVFERVAELRAATLGAEFCASAVDRAWSPDDCDALRRSALAAASIDDAQAGRLRALHGELCVRAHASPLPLLWPRRTAGVRVRVMALAAAAMDDLSTIEGLARHASRCDVVVAIMGSAGWPDDWPLSDAARELRVLPLPAVPGIEDARRIAALDPDLLLDLAGLAASGGPLLAARPARQIATLVDARYAHVAPLVDSAVPATHPALDQLLASAAIAEPSASSRLNAVAMSALWNAAVAAHGRGDKSAARAGYAEVLAEQPGFAPADYLLGIAAREAGEVTAARAHFEAAITAAPRYAGAVVAAARLAIDSADPAAAIDLCRRGIAAGQAGFELECALGMAQLALRDGEAAAATFVRALARSPLDGEAHYNHGVALQMQRDSAGAARAYQRALFVRPDLVAAHFNLGVLFQEQSAHDAAVAAYEAVLRADPSHVAAHKNLGETLLAAGRIDQWLASFERFEARCPNALPLAVQALEACQYRADFARLGRYLEGLRQEQFVAADELELVDCLEEILYLLLFFDVDTDLIHKFARTYDAAARRVYGEPLPRPESRRPGRVRIGYLSADLRDHVMGKMSWPAIEHSDPAKFELFCYSLSTHEDEWTAKFRGRADHYAVVAALPEAEAARRIAADDLDILVDLSTHTRGSRPGILAFKPARVQITHVASAGTVGLSAVDYKLTDRFADVPETQSDMIETLLPMAGCVYPYRHIAPAVDHPFQREQFGIAGDAFVIGAFITALKLSRRCLGLWREVLQRVPRAKLAFSPLNGQLRAQYARLAAAAGIAPDRIVILPQGRNEAENQARYSLVDVVLDPLPFGGANGTLEALDMGVPVVTLLGKRHGERTAYSILANLGVETTVARNGRDYVEIAVRLADDAGFMNEVRRAIRDRLPTSALADARLYTQRLEDAYLVALEARAPESLAGLAAVEIRVSKDAG